MFRSSFSLSVLFFLFFVVLFPPSLLLFFSLPPSMQVKSRQKISHVLLRTDTPPSQAFSDSPKRTNSWKYQIDAHRHTREERERERERRKILLGDTGRSLCIDIKRGIGTRQMADKEKMKQDYFFFVCGGAVIYMISIYMFL